MSTHGEKRFVAAVMLPTGAGGAEFLTAFPEGSVAVGEWIDAQHLRSRDDWNLVGRAVAAAMHRVSLKESDADGGEAVLAAAEYG